MDEIITYFSKPKPVDVNFLRLVTGFINAFRYGKKVKKNQEQDAQLAALIFRQLLTDIDAFPLDDLANIIYIFSLKAGV